MAQMEQLELDAQRARLVADVEDLVERYRSIFEWDIPEIDQIRSDRLILQAIREALDGVEKKLADEDAAA
jgi:molybdopterin converting factor small subunit